MRAIERIVARLYGNERLVKLSPERAVKDWAMHTSELVSDLSFSRGTILEKLRVLQFDDVVQLVKGLPGPGYHWALTSSFYDKVQPMVDAAFVEICLAHGAWINEWALMSQLRARGHAAELDTFGAVIWELVFRHELPIVWRSSDRSFKFSTSEWLKAAALARNLEADDVR